MKTTLIMTMGLGALLCLTGCASIVGQASQTVHCSSQPSRAAFTVTNADGETVASGTTPMDVQLKAGAGYFKAADYTVTFAGADGATREVKIKRGLNGWYFGNILFGGLIGMLVVDPLTGAMWNLEDSVHGDFTTLPVSSVADGNLPVVALNDVPNHLRNHMIPIE